MGITFSDVTVGTFAPNARGSRGMGEGVLGMAAYVVVGTAPPPPGNARAMEVRMVCIYIIVQLVAIPGWTSNVTITPRGKGPQLPPITTTIIS